MYFVIVLYLIVDNSMTLHQYIHVTCGKRRCMISDSNRIVVILLRLMQDQYGIW